MATMETWTKGVLVTEDNEVKSQEGQQPSTYEEEVVREETLLARRQESLDSVHFGSHGYEAGCRRESKLSCVVISVSKTPFVVVDVLFVSRATRETGVIAASWTQVHRHWTTFGDNKQIPPGSPFFLNNALHWPVARASLSSVGVQWRRRMMVPQNGDSPGPLAGAAGRDVTETLAADTCKRRRVDPYPKSSQHLFAARPNLQLPNPTQRRSIIIDFRRQPIHNG